MSRMPWADARPNALRSEMSHVAGSRNRARHHGQGRDWATPPEIFEPLDREFGFTLDPCCTEQTAKAPEFFTERDDGLSRPWAPHRVFMNPPYGREIPAWTQKALSESRAGALVVGLLPASTDSAWWHRDVVDVGAEVRYIRGRVRFVTSDGSFNSPFTPVLLVIWRPADALELSA